MKVTLSSEELNAVIDYDNMINQMEATLEHLRMEYAEQLSLRTSVNAFDSLIVDTPDGQFPLIQIAQVTQYCWVALHSQICDYGPLKTTHLLTSVLLANKTFYRG